MYTKGAPCSESDRGSPSCRSLSPVTGPFTRNQRGPGRSTRALLCPFGSLVFVETGAFDADQARAILTARAAKGLGLRVHASQLGPGPGVQLACELGAAAADHCTHLTDADIDVLASSGVVAGLLPAVVFSTRSPYPDARRLLDAGATVSLASDCNPGSCHSSSMPLCIALAVREMHMSPAEALWSATAGGAASLRRDDIGRVTVGARADLAVLDAPSYLHLAYRPGVPLITQTWLAGRPL